MHFALRHNWGSQRRSRYVLLAVGTGATVVLVLLFATIAMMQRNARLSHQKALEVDRIAATEHLINRLNSVQELLKYVADGLATGQIGTDLLNAVVQPHFINNPHMTQVAWIEGNGVVAWVETRVEERPLAGQLSLPPSQDASFNLARTSGAPTFTDPFEAQPGVLVFDVYVPVISGANYRGMLLARCDFERILKDFLPELITQKHLVTAHIEGGPAIYALGRSSPVVPRYAQDLGTIGPFPTLSITLTPYETGLETLGDTFFIVSVLLLLLLSAAIWWLLMDIRRRKQVEKALEASELRFRTLAEVASVGIWLLDKQGKTVFTNPAMNALLEVESTSHLEAFDYEAFFRPDSNAIKAREAADSAKLVVPVDAQLVGRRGTVRDVLLNFAKMTLNETEESLIVTALDVTLIRKMELEARDLETKMQHHQKLESLGLLAGGIAHDFNNLLVGMLGNASMALEELELTSPARRLVQNVQSAASCAADLTTQLLAYSGRGHFTTKAISLSELVAEMAPLIKVSNAQGVQIEQDLPDDLPMIKADPTQVRQVILNLAINAMEAIDRPHGRVTLRTGMMTADSAYLGSCLFQSDAAPGDFAYIEVEDNGCGIPLDTQKRIFDPFFTTKFTGRGLGMSAVMGIVRGHRGAIHVKSAPKRGTTMRVLFPIVDRIAAQALRPRALESRATYGEESLPPGATVLVVDDQIAVRTLAEAVLTKKGFRVLIAEDGEEGLDLFQQQPNEIDLIVLDLTMPHMDGEEAFQRMRAVRSDVPVIFSSGYDEWRGRPGDDERPLTSFLQKPYQGNDLIEAVMAMFPFRARHGSD